MKLAFIVFEGITWLDLIGIYDPISRLKSEGYLSKLTWDICADKPEVADNFGLKVKVGKLPSNLSAYDAIIVPGGLGTRILLGNRIFVEWIKTAREDALKISVCTGSLILGAAGFLKDKKATTNYREYQTLQPYCAKVIEDRIVEDGNVITAGAVSSSIDLGLYLCEKWAGPEAVENIRKKMAYQC